MLTICECTVLKEIKMFVNYENIFEDSHNGYYYVMVESKFASDREDNALWQMWWAVNLLLELEYPEWEYIKFFTSSWINETCFSSLTTILAKCFVKIV